MEMRNEVGKVFVKPTDVKFTMEEMKDVKNIILDRLIETHIRGRRYGKKWNAAYDSLNNSTKLVKSFESLIQEGEVVLPTEREFTFRLTLCRHTPFAVVGSVISPSYVDRSDNPDLHRLWNILDQRWILEVHIEGMIFPPIAIHILDPHGNSTTLFETVQSGMDGKGYYIGLATMIFQEFQEKEQEFQKLGCNGAVDVEKYLIEGEMNWRLSK